MTPPIQRRVARQCWAIKGVSRNQRDGHREWFEGEFSRSQPVHVLLFPTRAAARAYSKKHYGYIVKRHDLQAEPYGWKVPKVVRVLVTVEEVP